LRIPSCAKGIQPNAHTTSCRSCYRIHPVSFRVLACGVLTPGFTEQLCSVGQEKSDALWTHINMRVQTSMEDVSRGDDPDVKLPSISCPHCKIALRDEEIRSILGQFARSKRLSFQGASRFAKMTQEERSAEGRRAATARWAKRAAGDG
jgi:hypothetical protein